MSQERDKLRDKVFWAVTFLHSALGTCDRLLTAVSAEKDKRLHGFAYNGSLPGTFHCDEVGHFMINNHCRRTRHGERNLKDNTDQEKLNDSRVRILGTPCLDCLKDLAGAGVEEIEYTGYYDNQEFQPTPENLKEIFGDNFNLTCRDIDWVELFQGLFDRLAGPGGILKNLGYRIKLTKESKETRHEES